jgi:4-alpha-glucanotransferase
MTKASKQLHTRTPSSADGSRPTLDERASGVLLHVTSLPGPHGSGDIGSGARRFIDFLELAGQRWWQMLPINPAGDGNSPYSGVSVFAGNPLLISLEDLAAEGLLDAADVAHELPAQRVDYLRTRELRTRVLRRAFARFETQHDLHVRELDAFRERSAYFLPDYALFMALKSRYPDRAFPAWEPGLARRDAAALARARRELAQEIAYYEFEQFMFDRQWTALRGYAQRRGVGLIGDVPIFVAHDSADVWSHQAYFELDAQGEPSSVAGVPPDYFSQTGQRWGNPLYRWDALERDRFAFWVERFRTLMERFDVIRLDHFIGFVRCWQIPASESTAEHGRFVPGPGAKLFDAVASALGSLPFIAEDLGDVTPEVRALRDRFGLPGMRVLQFAFGTDPQASDFLPYSYVPGSVAYTGTHDNDTIVGWFQDPGDAHGPRSAEQAEHERQAAIAYLEGPLTRELHQPVHWEMLRAVFASPANTALIPMQDILGLGSEARMNRPGEAEGNWEWRLSPDTLQRPTLAAQLRAHSHVYGRLPANPSGSRAKSAG